MRIAAEKHQWARRLIVGAFTARHGREPSPFEASSIQAQAAGETGYGSWPFRKLDGTPVKNYNNWGAVQSRSPTISDASDKHADGTPYQQYFMVYPSHEAGCADLVRHMSAPMRPLTADAMARGQLEGPGGVSDAMRRENYYGGFCQAAVKKYGSAVRKKGTEAWDACHVEATAGHTKAFRLWFAEFEASGLPVGEGEGAEGKADGSGSSPEPEPSEASSISGLQPGDPYSDD